MKCRCTQHAALLLTMAMALLIERPACSLADGGVVQLQESAGPFVVTVFTETMTLRTGPVDVSVMVQRRDTSDVVLDASVELQFLPPPGAMVSRQEMFCGPDGTVLRGVTTNDVTGPRAIPATRGRATNKLLYAANVELPAAGDWRMRVRVQRPGAVVSVECALPVVDSGAGLAGVWIYLATPFVLVVLFGVHQQLKQRAMRSTHRPGAPSRANAQIVT